MDLKTYHESLPIGGRRSFAAALGIAPTYLYQMATGRRPVNPRLWAAMVRESEGAITLDDLAYIAAQDQAA